MFFFFTDVENLNMPQLMPEHTTCKGNYCEDVLVVNAFTHVINCNLKSSPKNAHSHHHYDHHNQDYPASLVEKALENHGAQLSQQLFKQLFQPQCQVKETRKSNSNTTKKT